MDLAALEMRMIYTWSIFPQGMSAQVPVHSRLYQVLQSKSSTAHILTLHGLVLVWIR